MARLPTPGGDDGNWGTILNEFLSVGLSENGELKIRTWENATSRPQSPVSGQIGINLETGRVEKFNGDNWIQLTGPGHVIHGSSSTPPDAENYPDGTLYFVTVE